MAVYFVMLGDAGPIKIGFSDNVPKRMGELERHYGVTPTLLHTEPGGRPEEDAWHERFAEARLGRTEQFRPVPELMDAIGLPLLVSENPDAVEAVQTVADSGMEAVKLPADVVRSARILAAYTGDPLAEMLADMLRPLLIERESREVARRQKELDAIL